MVNETLVTAGKQDQEQMKSCAFGMVSDLSQLLADKGFGESPIDIVEALIFTMFIIADTYSLAKPDKDQAIAVINSFYDDIQDRFIHQIIINDYNLSDAEEIQSVADKFHDLSRGRFTEYGNKFKHDISDHMGMSCPITVSYLLDNLFVQPIDQEEKLRLMGPVSDKVLHYWTGCVQYFK